MISKENAHCCACEFAYVLVFLMCICKCSKHVHVFVCVILLREIISSNVALGFFGCINILEDSRGETESLCKHKHHESVRVLSIVDLIIKTEAKKFCTHSKNVCVAVLNQVFLQHSASNHAVHIICQTLCDSKLHCNNK